MPGIDANELAELLRYCRQQGIVTVVDVVVSQSYTGMDTLVPLLPHIDYFLPNDDEAQRLTGIVDTEQQIETFLRHGVKTAIITCGADGAVAATGSGRWQGTICRMDTVDPSGSGDAFAAGVITGIMRRWDMPEMLRYAAALGASATTAIGTTDGVFTAEETQAFLNKTPIRVTHFSQDE